MAVVDYALIAFFRGPLWQLPLGDNDKRVGCKPCNLEANKSRHTDVICCICVDQQTTFMPL